MSMLPKTVEGEWWEGDIGVVMGVHGILWFGYPEKGCSRIGPFESLLEAQRALERQAGSDQRDEPRASDLDE